jgi:hypothetical protein
MTKADAEGYQQQLVQQAIEAGGRTYLTEGNYTTLTGKIILKPTGIERNRSGNHYRIGVENESTKFSIIPAELKSQIPAYKITDGLAYEIHIEDFKQRTLTEILARQDVVSDNIKKFATEIKPMTDIYQVLKSFIKYSNKKSDKKMLAAIAIGKIQELL